MSDYSKLKKLATTCSIARISGWRGQMGVDESEILALIAENERLRAGMKGDYDLDAWLDWDREAEALRKDAERYRYASRNLIDLGSWTDEDIDTAMSKELKA